MAMFALWRLLLASIEYAKRDASPGCHRKMLFLVLKTIVGNTTRLTSITRRYPHFGRFRDAAQRLRSKNPFQPTWQT